ncbi:hypothetical protein JZ751_005902 [Albula glossodonta]|uniref:Uncharacterized protein n=1 Tax=Albula glossodonta TaxID=121402 RepID=A0A8T2P332_9TELE|nr:hypothetical protein JZ751_005902 [Albula glossodonta]
MTLVFVNQSVVPDLVVITDTLQQAVADSLSFLDVIDNTVTATTTPKSCMAGSGPTIAQMTEALSPSSTVHVLSNETTENSETQTISATPASKHITTTVPATATNQVQTDETVHIKEASGNTEAVTLAPDIEARGNSNLATPTPYSGMTESVYLINKGQSRVHTEASSPSSITDNTLLTETKISTHKTTQNTVYSIKPTSSDISLNSNITSITTNSASGTSKSTTMEVLNTNTDLSRIMSLSNTPITSMLETTPDISTQTTLSTISSPITPPVGPVHTTAAKVPGASTTHLTLFNLYHLCDRLIFNHNCFDYFLHQSGITYNINRYVKPQKHNFFCNTTLKNHPRHWVNIFINSD